MDREDPRALPVVTAVCPNGSTTSFWLVEDAGLRTELIRTTLRLPQAIRGPLCDVRVFLRCAPDLDGDREPDFLARLLGQSLVGETTSSTCESVADSDPRRIEFELIVAVTRSRESTGWSYRAADVVTSWTEDSASSTQRVVRDFVRLANGHIAIRGETQHSETTETISQWVGVLQPDRRFRILSEVATPDVP